MEHTELFMMRDFSWTRRQRQITSEGPARQIIEEVDEQSAGLIHSKYTKLFYRNG